ncbi:asparaginase domain-containing protein [Flagellimonas olearia]|uniref:L-asparaginase N-terminal domain-containing protein n=1 Tax=Flagellimonas olearia TaxID=552546 RepID=A0A444VLR8_9FLAO|nr:asparaginase domain-containing protein [Allomuricauda olearia]RYC51745.1 hypothetical protein DN53_13020 [Allomuricauda olearia]
MKITFIQTGGTIDKDYPKVTKGWAFEFGEPAIQRIMDKLEPAFEYKIVTACQKDSSQLLKKDLDEIANLIRHDNGVKFIITHGTDTMIQTALYLNKVVKDKLVIITGAIRPERFSNSDAPINLGSAIAATNLLEKGIYITMHGVVKSHLDINRNLETGKFF